MPNIAVELGKVSTQLGVNAVYGEEREVDGVSIVPVAAAWSGFAGGSDEKEKGGSSGGGGGGLAVPIGAYVRRPEGLRFEPNLIALLTVGIPFVLVAGNALRKIIRALKR